MYDCLPLWVMGINKLGKANPYTRHTYTYELRSPNTIALIVQKIDSAKTMNGAKGQDVRVSKIDYIYCLTVS